jgi:hypothetical protein
VVAGLWIAAMAVTRTAGAAVEAAGGAAQATAQSPSAQQEIQQRSGEIQQQVQGLREQAEARKDEAAGAARKAGTAGSLGFFLYGVLTLAAAMAGGRAGVPRDRIVAAREETVPPPAGAPLSPQRV